jgi:hypothetical protein
VTDTMAHYLIIAFVVGIVAFVAIVLVVGRRRLRRGAQLPADPHAVTLDDSVRAQTINTIVEHTRH